MAAFQRSVFRKPASFRHAPRFVPERHTSEIEAPRLTAAFVAQLLGQLLPDREIRKLQARAAYGTDEAEGSLLLDTRL